MMSKVSIIVPVYNMEQYLEECIQSIRQQTLRDIEIICVDDGSTDNSANLLEEYGKLDKRIKVLHKRNTGYGDSVNVGAAGAEGEYIGIVEPDDYVALDMYEILYYTAKKENLEVVKGNFAEFWGIGKERKFIEKKVIEDKECYEGVLDSEKISRLYQGYIINPAGIYSKEFLTGYEIFHNTTPGASYQDVGFWYQVLAQAERIKLVDKTLYFYRQDNNSSSIHNRGKIFCICDEYDFLFQFMRKKVKDKFWDCYLSCMMASYQTAYYRIAVQYRREFIERAHEDFCKLRDGGWIDTSLLRSEEIARLHAILDCPEECCIRALKETEEIHMRVKPYANIVIYGAGKIGQKLLKGMYEEDYRKVIGFAVTENGKEVRQIEGKKICCISEYESRKNEIAVLVGVSEKYRTEILQTLRNYEFPHVVVLA